MKKLTTLLTALAVISFFGTAFAQLDIGGDIKVLGYISDNVEDASDEPVSGIEDQTDFLRTEAHIWFQADLSDNVTTRVSIEADRAFNMEDEEGGQNDLDVFLEEAWIQAMYLYDSAFSAKIGRQFIEFGDGFIIGDGAPDSEGSLNNKGEWEVDPFDAVVGWYDGDDWVLNAVLAKAVETGPADEDADLYGLYFTYSGVEDWVFDLYGFFANIENDNAIPEITSDATDIFNITPYNADIYMIGARIAGSALEGFSYKLEGVYEFGDIDVRYATSPFIVPPDQATDVDVKAWAIEAGIKYMVDAEYNPWVGFTYVYLSGDDGKDEDYENFLSPFDNRVYGEIANVDTNAHVFNLAGGLDVNEDVAVSAKYYYLMAAEDEPYANEDEIGHEVDAFLDYQFSEETTATLAAGFFAPGDILEKEGRDDTAWFVRGGVKVEF